ncbi:A-kinase anchor protein 12b isoform X2 [Amphiprion ocellaris]|uniref:A-kinase anchor protein 12b isoform X2 n=1 Tax=Amphiprion ocellaris TaxID=80972 RepID=UPI000C30BA19|nr:A-kinase anchor protein 12b isoform X2 [Amphiprion ocellaris]
MLGTITLTVGQPDGVSVAQKEEAPETTDTIQDEVTPQVNGEKVDKESPDANDISAVEEKAAEEKPDDASEVGFKKIFRFVGFKFTLKKDKSEEKDPVQLLTVKDKEGEEVSGTDEPAKETEVAAAEETKADTEASAVEVPPEATDEVAKEEGAVKEGETSPASQDTTVSPFRKLFTGGLFSNLRKKSSIKKTKEEEDKEAAAEEEKAKTEQSATAVEEEGEKFVTDHETKVEELETLVEDTPTTSGNEKSEATPEPKGTSNETTADTKQEDQKAEAGAEEEKAPAEMTSEAELLSSQEKTKPQGSPLKKIFTGAGLKKLSTKKQKVKKDTESKPSESGEQAAEQLQSSPETAEAPKADSGPSSPEESGEHVMAVEVTQNEPSQENEGEVASDGEKKKEGIIAWSSFKKLVTPKKRVKRSSESEDEATAEKPAKSATLSSSESAALADKGVEEEGKEDKPSEEEPKTENTEKLVSSTEEPKKKMDTSVSWEALMCMGGPKKRTRKTSDSDDEETKIEEEVPEGEQEGKTEAAIVTSKNTENEGEGVSSPDALSSPPERESTWDTLKRMVMSKNKSKIEEKPEESADQVLSDGEISKDESSFSLKKLFPGRKKKKVEKQFSSDLGSGEEESDTPAVVPLSEYDDQVEAEKETPAGPAEIQIKVSAAEDRSPSWIPAIVEDTDDKLGQLSDIPEEAENASTPKSVEADLTEAEDKAALLRVQGRPERRLSTAEVKPVPQAPDAATTPVAQGPTSESAVEIMQGIEAQVSEIPTQTSVTVEDVPMEVASEQIEQEIMTETAISVTNALLVPHPREEAMAICTGLGTKEIARADLQEPLQPILESMAVLCDPLNTEMLVTEKPPSTEEASAGEDEVFTAQIQQVDTTDLEPSIENSVSIDTEIEVADESYEPEFEIIGAVSRVDVNVENTPVTEIIEPLESNSYESMQTTITEETEPAIPVAAPSEETPIITETVVLVAPLNVESDQVVTLQPVLMGNVSVSETVGFEPTKVQKTKGEGAVAGTVEATAIPTEKTDISAIIEHASVKIEGVKEEVKQDSEIEAQSMVIAQAVIQDAVDKVSEDVPEHKKSPKLTALIPRPVKAVATIEKEIDIETETPVITDTPVAVICEKPVTKLSPYFCLAMEVSDTIPIEFTGSLEGEKKNEKPVKGLKKAVEVKASEETVIVEEVEEIKEETGEDLEQIKEEQINEDEESEVKEAAEEVKSQLEDAESKQKVLSVHMPVQVVLQTAEVKEELSFEEEAAEEFGGNTLPAKRPSSPASSPAKGSKLPVLSEEPQAAAEEMSQPETEKAPSAKCAQVMAQVIEVIEEAVKEIEPASSDITATS